MIDPQWQGVFEGWSRRFVNQNFWRVEHKFQTREDALQECALIFARCRKYYLAKANSDAHFMSLYKTAVHNDFITFARKDSQERQCEEDALCMHAVTAQYAKWGVAEDRKVAIALLSDEAKSVLFTLANAPAEVARFIFSAPTHKLATRRLRRLCGIKEYDGDIIAELHGALNP